ncbi:MAG: multidrug ABC transporter permease [Alphaproteobacteria bacterium]|nr:MAG: multidrug ABC transporter permease [Alphaproteobacteria bacterium]
MHDDLATMPVIRTRRIGGVNRLGLWTLYVREVRRFLKVYLQTILAPALTTLLFLVIFIIALGRQGRMVAGVDFASFLAPGLIAMTIIQNAFANTSSSLVQAKVQGTIVDFLMPPLSAGELVFGFAAGGVTRAIIVGAAVAAAVAAWPGIAIRPAHGLVFAYFVLSAALMLSLVGILTGIWADKFDHAAAVTNFVVQPLSLLSGTFYAISALPPFWQALSHANPFFYLIDGMRYGMIGVADGKVALGVVVVLAINIGLWLGCLWMFRTGYKLKS